jgi:hypothetical protein
MVRNKRNLSWLDFWLPLWYFQALLWASTTDGSRKLWEDTRSQVRIKWNESPILTRVTQPLQVQCRYKTTWNRLTTNNGIFRFTFSFMMRNKRTLSWLGFWVPLWYLPKVYGIFRFTFNFMMRNKRNLSWLDFWLPLWYLQALLWASTTDGSRKLWEDTYKPFKNLGEHVPRIQMSELSISRIIWHGIVA